MLIMANSNLQYEHGQCLLTCCAPFVIPHQIKATSPQSLQSYFIKTIDNSDVKYRIIQIIFNIYDKVWIVPM